MSNTIIDSLVVLFGLDAEGYKKGAKDVKQADADINASQEAQTTKAVKREKTKVDATAKSATATAKTRKVSAADQKRIDESTQQRERERDRAREKAEKEQARAAKKRIQDTAKDSRDAAKSIMSLGYAVGAMFLGFEGVTGLASWLGNINAGEAQLGRTSLKTGMGAHELNKWGNATAMAGGKPEDAQEAFGQLSGEFNTQRTTGITGPLLTFLRARGVAVSDANRKLRNQGQILEELADKTEKYGAVYQSNMFRQAGLNEGEIDYLIQSKELRQEQLAIAEKNNGVSAESVAEAKRLQEEWRVVSQQITAAGQAVVKDLAPAVLEVLQSVTSIIDKLVLFKQNGNGFFEGIEANKKKAAADGNTYAFGTEWRSPAKAWREINAEEEKRLDAQGPGPSFSDILKSSKAAYTKDSLLRKIASTETQLGIPAGMLARIAEQESHFRPDIISGHTKSAAGAVGLMQLMPNVFKGAEKMTPEQQIAVAGAELKRLYKVFGDWQKAVAAYNDGEGNEKKVLAGRKVMPDETRKYIAAVAPTPDIYAGSSNTNNTTSHTTSVSAPITVIAQNADPTAVADQTASALQRKISAAQALQGQS